MNEATAKDSLQMEQICVDRLGTPVVKSVDMTVASGKITVLLGANGVGKSTLLDGISGVAPIRSGRITLGGSDLSSSSRRARVKKGLSYVQQGRQIFPSLTVEENFLVTAPPTEFDRVFDLFPELVPRKTTKTTMLSGGEQQMVVLGRALLQKPKILMIDELSLGLAPIVVERMLTAVEQMAAEGLGVLLVEQFADRALASADNALVLSRGEVVLRGKAGDIRSQPEMLRSAYLG